MPVTHIIESAAAEVTTLRLLRDLIAAPGPTPGSGDAAPMQHQVILVGPRSLAETAAAVELPVARHLCTSGSKLADVIAMRSLRRCGVDVVHTMSLRGATLAAVSLGRRVRRCATITHPIEQRMCPVMRRGLRAHELNIIAIGPTTHQSLLDARLPAANIRISDPVTDPAALSSESRTAIRLRLGAGDEAVKLALIVGENPREIDVLHSTFAAGLVDETRRPVRVVVAPHLPGRLRAIRIVTVADRTNRVITTDAATAPWSLAPACDLAIALGGGQSLAWAMTAGLPIAAIDHPAVRDQLTDHETALLAPAHSAGELARRLRRLYDEPELARRLGRAAADRARDRYAPADRAPAWRTLWAGAQAPPAPADKSTSRAAG